MDERTRKVVLKTADIDVGIIPVVNWLNSFHSTFTLWCCEGRKKGEPRCDPNGHSAHPYVTFLCGELRDLDAIHAVARQVAARLTGEDYIEVGEDRYYRERYTLTRFELSMSSRHVLQVLTETLARNKVEEAIKRD